MHPELSTKKQNKHKQKNGILCERSFSFWEGIAVITKDNRPQNPLDAEAPVQHFSLCVDLCVFSAIWRYASIERLLLLPWQWRNLHYYFFLLEFDFIIRLFYKYIFILSRGMFVFVICFQKGVCILHDFRGKQHWWEGSETRLIYFWPDAMMSCMGVNKQVTCTFRKSTVISTRVSHTNTLNKTKKLTKKN